MTGTTTFRTSRLAGMEAYNHKYQTLIKNGDPAEGQAIPTICHASMVVKNYHLRLIYMKDQWMVHILHGQNIAPAYADVIRAMLRGDKTITEVYIPFKTQVGAQLAYTEAFQSAINDI